MIIKDYLSDLFGKRRQQYGRQSARPSLEVLEPREVPTTFTWTNAGGNGIWENGANWAGGGAGAYPGFDGTNSTTNDVAQFGNTFLASSTMQQAHELTSLTIASGYTGVLTLQKQLTLNGGGSMAGGTIIQKTPTANGPIDITGGVFEWSGGNINYSTTTGTSTSTFTVETGGSFYFTNDHPGSSLGDDLINYGESQLANTATITLFNRPTITNGGVIDIITDNPSGLAVGGGDLPVTIQNTGTISKSGTDGTYEIDDGINNSANGAQLNVVQGILEFKLPDPTTGFSVNQSAGTIQITSGTTTLTADAGLYQTGGTTLGIGPSTSTINAKVQMLGGTLQQGDGTATGVGTLQVNGDFQWRGGTVQLFYDTNAGKASVIQDRGSTGIAINRTGTTLAESFLGTGAMPGTIDVMRTFGATASISPNPAQTNPAGYTASLISIGTTTDTYRLTKNAGGGAPASASADNLNLGQALALVPSETHFRVEGIPLASGTTSSLDTFFSLLRGSGAGQETPILMATLLRRRRPDGGLQIDGVSAE